MNYKKLMDSNPTCLGNYVNTIGQSITFYEHPTLGESAPVIAVCHDLELAATTDFYETGDMTAEHKEYEPIFAEGRFQHGN